VASLPNLGNNYYQNVKILTEKNKTKKVDSFWWAVTSRPHVSVKFQSTQCIFIIGGSLTHHFCGDMN